MDRCIYLQISPTHTVCLLCLARLEATLRVSAGAAGAGAGDDSDDDRDDGINIELERQRAERFRGWVSAIDDMAASNKATPLTRLETATRFTGEP